MTTTEMTTTKPTATEPSQLKYTKVSLSAPQSNLQIAQHIYELMFRNVASDGFVFTDPTNPSQFSTQGCIIASPSYEQNLVVVKQNYVYNWTRDAAIAAMELAAANMPTRPGEAPQPLIDYVNFVSLCQNNAVRNGFRCARLNPVVPLRGKNIPKRLILVPFESALLFFPIQTIRRRPRLVVGRVGQRAHALAVDRRV